MKKGATRRKWTAGCRGKRVIFLHVNAVMSHQHVKKKQQFRQLI